MKKRLVDPPREAQTALESSILLALGATLLEARASREGMTAILQHQKTTSQVLRRGSQVCYLTRRPLRRWC